MIIGDDIGSAGKECIGGEVGQGQDQVCGDEQSGLIRQTVVSDDY